VETLWYSDRFSARLARLLLLPVSLLYELGSILFRKVYDWGWKTAAQPHPRAVCIGNLTVGGNGKTPVTIAVAQLLIDRGYAVIVGASGYGSDHESDAQFAPDDAHLDAKVWGDEGAVIREHLPGVPLVVGRNRVRAAELAYARDPHSILVMDDGFQHLRLKTRVQLLIASPSRNYRCLPAGPYRESSSAIRYSSLTFGAKYQIQYHRTASQSLGATFHLLTAIANPERFLATVTELGGSPPATTRYLPDHDPLNAGNLLEGYEEGATVVVTEKDWVKLRVHPDGARVRWVVVRQTATIEPAAFADWLIQKLETE